MSSFLVAAPSWRLAVVLAAPVVVVLLLLAFKAPRKRRLGNLLSGLLGAVAGAFAMFYSFEPPQRTWMERWYGLFIVAAMIAGVGVAAALSRAVRFVIARRTSDAR
ncbi:MAG: hypothetical protein WD278_04845 [Pirellulales bacterium]